MPTYFIALKRPELNKLLRLRLILVGENFSYYYSTCNKSQQ